MNSENVIPAEAGTQKKESLDNLAVVLAYLVNDGWKITKTTLYRHKNEGRFLPDKDGSYAVETIDRYAKLHLKKSATGKKVNQETDELQQLKLEQEIDLQKIKIDRERFNYEKDQGLHIAKDQVELNMALMYSVIFTGLRHWIQSKAPEWIALASGDIKKQGELINAMTNDLDVLSNQFSKQKEYEIVIEENDEIKKIENSKKEEES